MLVRVLTSCTSKKAASPPPASANRPNNRPNRPAEHRSADGTESASPSCLPLEGEAPARPAFLAEELYTGQQQLRLMRGVRRARQTLGQCAVDLWIVSAGYGVVHGSERICPYDATFAGVTKRQRRELAAKLEIPGRFRAVLARPADLTIVILGRDYLEACTFGDDVLLGAPALVFCGQQTARTLPALAGLHAVVLSRADARRFGCGLVGLKGEVAGRLLALLAERPELLERWQQGDSGILALLGAARPAAGLQLPAAIDR